MADAQDTTTHVGVLQEAMEIYLEREKKHKGLWKSNSLGEGNLHIMSKAKRFVQDPASHIDDGLDLINYVVFQILNVREGRV